MDAILSNPDLQDAIVDGQLAAVDRLQAKDFDGTLLRFVDQHPQRRRGRARRVWRSTSGISSTRPRSSRKSACTGRRRYKALPEAPGMIVNQWVPAAHKGDAIGDSARRMRGLLRGMGHTSEILRADDRRRAEGRRAAVRRSGGATRRPDDLPLRAAVADDRGVRAAAGGRASCSTTTSRRRRYFAAVRSGALPPGVDRAPGTGDARRPSRSGARRLRIQPAGTRSARIRADRRAAAGGRPVASHQAVPRPALDKILDDDFVNFLFVGRIAPNKKIEDHIRLAEHYKRYVDAYYRFIFVGKLRRGAALLRDDPRADVRISAPERALHLHRSGAGRGPGRLLPPRGRVHLAQRARRVLRAAARGDGDRRARARVCCGRRAGNARRRRRAVRAQRSGIRSGTARRPRVRRRPAGAGDRRPAATARRLQRRPHRTRHWHR